MDCVHNTLNQALEDWSMMQKTDGDEGADWAETFELHFYEFIDDFKKWYESLPEKPQTVEKLEEMSEVKEIQDKLPGPLQLNFTMEMEEIVDGLSTTRYDD
ncbi:hypothetical protein [Salisediminibacterium beveridgei]|uniref:Uncharacterized protein n=1 Tax=Salisediminibacterium beveridgei TaxID=632773 RepID=A0A1D7QV56_9BACI|nr:hypothetical protein [Salisediminibacterium beveridgei]AOM82906.1 hypothetical protein BBEV_1545 [Salisediminibacterium beveridgei]